MMTIVDISANISSQDLLRYCTQALIIDVYGIKTIRPTQQQQFDDCRIASLCYHSYNDDELMITRKCGPMTNVMVALPNIGSAICSTPQRLAFTHY